MNIFLSYASGDREVAEEVQLALTGAGHRVFFDRESLPAGGDYHARIRNAVERSDIFVYLISAKSVTTGSYALTELKYAREKWPHPKGRVIPVLLRDADRHRIPNYLNAVTWLEPEGNIAAEVVAAVAKVGWTGPVPPKRIRAPGLLAALAVLIAAGSLMWWRISIDSSSTPSSSIPSCPVYSPSGPVSGLWQYSMKSESGGPVRGGELELTMKGQLVAGILKSQFDRTKPCVSGKYVNGTLELSRPTGPVQGVDTTIQKYKLKKQSDRKFIGEYWNEDGWPDHGSIEIER